MAFTTGEIEALGIHVHVEISLWLFQRTIQVTVFNSITAATVEVTGAAACAAGFANFLSDRFQICWLTELA